MKPKICCFIGHQNLRDYNIEKICSHARLEDNATNICASIVPTQINKEQLPNIIDWCFSHNIFPLIGDLEDAGKGKALFDKLKIRETELQSLKNYIFEKHGEDYTIPICPSVLFGVHINHKGNINDKDLKNIIIHIIYICYSLHLC